MNIKSLFTFLLGCSVFVSTPSMSSVNGPDYVKYGDTTYESLLPNENEFIRCSDMYGVTDKETAYLAYAAYDKGSYEMVHCAVAYLEKEGDLKIGATVPFNNIEEVDNEMMCPEGYAITGFGREGDHFTDDPLSTVSYECSEILHANGTPLQLTDDELVVTVGVSDKYENTLDCWDATSGVACHRTSTNYPTSATNGMLVGRSVKSDGDEEYYVTLTFRRIKSISENTQLTVSNNSGSQMEFSAELMERNGDYLNVQEAVEDGEEYVSPELISPLNGESRYHLINELKLANNEPIARNCYIFVDKSDGKFIIDNQCTDLDVSIDDITGTISINVTD